MKKLLLTLSIILFASVSNAKTYKIFTPGPAGSGSDIVARMIATQLEADTKDTFIVVNKPGASGLVGYKSFLADNQNNDIIYMLGGTTLTLPNMDNAFDEFTPVIALYNVHYYVLVRKDSNFKTIKDITGKLNVSTSNNASEVLFKHVFKGDIQTINYKSENQSIAALVSKEVDVASVSSQNTVMNSVKDQVLVFNPFPKNAINPLGFIVGKNTPDSERDYLNKMVNAALSKPEISKFMQDNFGVKPEGGTPEHFIKLLTGFRQVIIPLAKDAK